MSNPPKNNLPFSVIIYFCRDDVGLSGTVYANNPSFIKGLTYISLNLSRLLYPSFLAKSERKTASKALSKTKKNSSVRLLNNLPPFRSVLTPFCEINFLSSLFSKTFEFDSLSPFPVFNNIFQFYTHTIHKFIL